jgi:hypothetical protein
VARAAHALGSSGLLLRALGLPAAAGAHLAGVALQVLQVVADGRERGVAFAALRAACVGVNIKPELDALVRRDQLEDGARVELFRELAGRLRGLVEFPTEAVEGLSDEQYVRNAVEILYRIR